MSVLLALPVIVIASQLVPENVEYRHVAHDYDTSEHSHYVDSHKHYSYYDWRVYHKDGPIAGQHYGHDNGSHLHQYQSVYKQPHSHARSFKNHHAFAYKTHYAVEHNIHQDYPVYDDYLRGDDF